MGLASCAAVRRWLTYSRVCQSRGRAVRLHTRAHSGRRGQTLHALLLVLPAATRPTTRCPRRTLVDRHQHGRHQRAGARAEEGRQHRVELGRRQARDDHQHVEQHALDDVDRRVAVDLHLHLAAVISVWPKSNQICGEAIAMQAPLLREQEARLLGRGRELRPVPEGIHDRGVAAFKEVVPSREKELILECLLVKWVQAIAPNCLRVDDNCDLILPPTIAQVHHIAKIPRHDCRKSGAIAIGQTWDVMRPARERAIAQRGEERSVGPIQVDGHRASDVHLGARVGVHDLERFNKIEGDVDVDSRALEVDTIRPNSAVTDMVG